MKPCIGAGSNPHLIHAYIVSRHSKKTFLFVFEGLGSLGCGFYGSYVFFLFRDRFGFGNAGNLSLSALQGLVWALAAWQGGRFAGRFGGVNALRVGLAGMVAALLAGAMVPTLGGQIAVLVVWTVASCFVWPALESLVSEGEDRSQLPRRLGIYNVVWATCSALSFFCGGAVFEHLGSQSMFWLPIGICVLQYGLLTGHTAGRQEPASPALPEQKTAHEPEAVAFRQPVSPRTFLHMAWLANPFTCIGINTLLATIPTLAKDLHLSTTASGLFCSVWFFARLAAFVVLWQWRGWHYRFRWLLGALLGLMAGFGGCLIGRELWLLVVAQAVFGFSVGLVYYSSLFYSMDVGRAKGEYGGLHEAAMGLGNFFGPALGVAALVLMPQTPNAGAYAVSGLLAAGVLGVCRLRFKAAKPDAAGAKKPA